MKRMKKIIAMAIALMMILTTLTAIVPSAAAVETTGDVAREPVPAMADFNGDGKLDSADVLAMLRHLMNPAKYPWDHPHDFNADGRETVTDAIYFLRHIFFGDVYELNFACTAHNEASYADVAATCTAPGYTGGTYCSLCGQTLTERTVVPARGHNYVDGVCDICGDIKTSTCTGEHNFVDNVCTNCGERGSAGLKYTTGGKYDASTDSYVHFVAVSGIGTCTDTDIIIPKTYNGRTVTDIGNSAFESNTTITSVEIQEGLQEIRSWAFLGCTELTTVSIPESIMSIDNYAFNGCSKLQFNVYDNAKYLGNAENKYLLLYDTLTTSMTSCEIHADTKVINNFAFEDCRNLVSITIPDGVIRIGDYAFSSCSQLTAMNIPASVSSIGTAPFEYCSNLSTLMVANDNEYYCAEDGILYNKSKTEIIAALPACVSGTVAIPDSVVTILPYAFENCGNITSIQFGENSNLEAVRYYAFKDCVLLESINFLESVNNIHYGAFVECVKLTGITVDDANSNYSTDGMVVFNKDKTSIMLVSGALTGEYVIPDSVTTLADGAFAYSNVTSVVIHDGITDIPEVAFNYCRKLNSIYIGKGVTHIGSLAFQWCDKLEYITILCNHSYTSQTMKDAALKSAGTCKDEAVYYYSCASCGAVEKDDNHTFKGAKDSANHAGTDTETRGAKDTVHTKDALEAGYTGDVCYKCCGAVKEQGTEIPAPEHKALDEWKYSDTQHWKECSCGKIMVAAADHTPATPASCTAKAVCSACNQSYGNTLPHNYSVADTAKEGALVSAGTCKTKAVYRYSCSCGALEENYGTHTFEGDKDPQNHTGGTELVDYLAPNHETQTNGYTGDTKCLGCGETISSGQTITVTPHAESETWAKDATHHWHTCTVEGCTYTYEKFAHRGGTATCKDKATCEDCDQAYGELSTTHDYSAAWSKDADGHWHVCTVCGAMQEAAKAAHTPDREAPTETEAVKCTVCEYVIEKALGHVCAFDKEVKAAAYLKTAGTCVKPAVYYKSCECGEKSDTLTFNGDVDSTVHERSNTSGYRAPNHVKQTAGETGVTTCADCGVVLKSNQKIAPSVHRSEKTYAHNSDEHWKTCEYTGCDAEVLNTRAAHTYGNDGTCTVCGYKKAETPAAPIRGDFKGDGKVDSNDAIYLLKNTFFGNEYPLNQGGDLNGDGKVDSNDAIYLLKHVFFGSDYPLSKN